MAIALRTSLARALVSPPKIDSDLQLVHARLRGLLPGSDALLHVISCYMLCEGSALRGAAPWKSTTQRSNTDWTT